MSRSRRGPRHLQMQLWPTFKLLRSHKQIGKFLNAMRKSKAIDVTEKKGVIHVSKVAGNSAGQRVLETCILVCHASTLSLALSRQDRKHKVFVSLEEKYAGSSQRLQLLQPPAFTAPLTEADQVAAAPVAAAATAATTPAGPPQGFFSLETIIRHVPESPHRPHPQAYTHVELKNRGIYTFWIHIGLPLRPPVAFWAKGLREP